MTTEETVLRVQDFVDHLERTEPTLYRAMGDIGVVEAVTRLMTLEVFGKWRKALADATPSLAGEELPPEGNAK